MAIKLHTKHNGLTSEDRREYETVFDTFFESSCHYGLIIADGIFNLQTADSTDIESDQEAAQIAKEAKISNLYCQRKRLWCYNRPKYQKRRHYERKRKNAIM